MTIDFTLINDKKVGSKIQEIEVPFKGLYTVEISFKEFIVHYMRDNRTYAEVHNTLLINLTDNFSRQKNILGSEASELLQERSMLMNSLKLIKQNYYQPLKRFINLF